MIDFGGYTKAKIEADMLAQVDPNIDTREGSMVQTAVAPGAWWLEGLYLILDQIQKNAYVETAEGQDLDLAVSNRDITRKAATPAVRQGTFLDDNNDPVTIPVGSRFKTINGEDSVVFVSGDLISAGVYELTCETPGIIGNSYTGAILPITAINGLATATIGTIITVGAEEETDEALRLRYKQSFSATAFGGNIASYREAILAVSGVGAVQVYPNVANQGGNVRCCVIGDDLNPASAELRSELQTLICPPVGAPSYNGYGVAPIGAKAVIVAPTETLVNISCDVTWETGRGGDADIQAVKSAISNYITEVKQGWGAPLIGYSVSYSVTIYISRVIAAIVAVDGVVSTSNVLIGGSASDMTITGEYLPKLGVITINGV